MKGQIAASVSTEPGNGEVLSRLDLLVGDIKEIQELERLLGGDFNFFEASGMAKSEVKHCSFLAYLLTPSAAHHVDDLFLRSLLSRVVTQDKTLQITLAELYLRDLSKADVRTEINAGNAGRVDLLIDIPPGLNQKRWVFLIEAKIDASEGSEQTARYTKWAHAKYGQQAQVTLLYLSRSDAHGPESESFHRINWDDVYAAIGDVLTRRGKEMTGAVRESVGHYLNLLKSQSMLSENDDLIRAQEIATELYRRHRSALDFIFQNVPSASGLKNDLGEALSRNGEFVFDAAANNKYWVNVVPLALEGVKGKRAELRHSGWMSGRPLFIGLLIDRPDSIFIKLEVGPLKDIALRTSLIGNLAEALGRKRNEKLNPGATITTVWSERFSVSISSDDDPKKYADEVVAIFLKSELYTKLQTWVDVVLKAFP